MGGSRSCVRGICTVYARSVYQRLGEFCMHSWKLVFTYAGVCVQSYVHVACILLLLVVTGQRQ